MMYSPRSRALARITASWSKSHLRCKLIAAVRSKDNDGKLTVFFRFLWSSISNWRVWNLTNWSHSAGFILKVRQLFVLSRFLMTVRPGVWTINDRSLDKSLEIFQDNNLGMNFRSTKDDCHEATIVKQFWNEGVIIFIAVEHIQPMLTDRPGNPFPWFRHYRSSRNGRGIPRYSDI